MEMLGAARRITLVNALIAGILALFFLITALSFHFLYHAPTIGVKASWDPSTHAWKIDASSHPGIRPGDVLYAIDGLRIGFHEWLNDNIHMKDRAEIFTWFEAKRGLYAALSKSHVTVSLFRNGSPINIRVPVRRAELSFLYRIEALHFICGSGFLVLGLIVIYRRGPDETGLVFFLFCLSFMILFTTNATSMVSESVFEPRYFVPANIANIMCTVACAAFVAHFSLLMPAKAEILVRFPRLVWIYYAVCAVITFGLFLEIMNVLFPALFLGALAIMGFRLYRCKDPIQRQQLKWVLTGFGFGLFPFVLVNGIPMMLGGERLINDTVPGFFLIFVPLFMAFAIQKYRLMDIDSLFDNTLIYGATFGALAIIDLLVLSALSHFSSKQTSPGLAAGVLGLWLAVLVYAPIRNTFRKWIRRLLKREDYNLKEIATRLSTQLISCFEVSDACRITMTVIEETLHPIGGRIWLLPEVGVDREPDDVDRAVARDILDKLEGLQGPALLCTLRPSGLIPEYSGGVVVPFGAAAGRAGCIILKNKVTGRPYSREDLSLLDMIGGQISLAILSISAQKVAIMKDRESREIKEHISQEMHDGIGGILSNSIMMLDLMANELCASPANNQRVRAMRGTLTEGLAEIRTLIQTVESESTSISDLKDAVERKINSLLGAKNIEAIFDVDIENYGLLLPPLAIHNLAKIVQEGITNALKHAHATQIRVSIFQRDGRISVSISDNGTGKNPEPPRHPSYGLRNMERRCKEIGAQLSIDDSPGNGFRIVALLPAPDVKSI
jgi:signal transduction histidine kinase